MNELFGVSIELVRQYVLRCINEETITERESRDDNINRLKDFTVDVKSSDRFLNVVTTRGVVEVFTSVAETEYDKRFVLGGGTYLLMALGVDKYNQLIKHLTETIILGNLIPGQTNTIDEMAHMSVLRCNPWLTFCVLARFTWFSQPEPQQGA